MALTSIDDRIAAAFMARFEQRGDDECWPWTGYINDHRGGYGQHTIGKWTWQAHRAVYEIFVGPIPEGLVLDHLCSVRTCVNPAHLEPVTQAENLRRSRERLGGGWGGGGPKKAVAS